MRVSPLDEGHVVLEIVTRASNDTHEVEKVAQVFQKRWFDSVETKRHIEKSSAFDFWFFLANKHLSNPGDG